jgi:putative transcriptional regulator
MSKLLDWTSNRRGHQLTIEGIGMVLANIVRYLRYRQGECWMTQQELAERVGVSRQTINAIERGKHQPSLELAFKLADVFGKTIDEVFSYFPEVDIDDDSLKSVTVEIHWDGRGA